MNASPEHHEVLLVERAVAVGVEELCACRVGDRAVRGQGGGVGVERRRGLDAGCSGGHRWWS